MVARDVDPTATPSMGTGNAAASVAAAIRSAIPAPSFQVMWPDASQPQASARPVAPTTATDTQTANAARELASRCSRCAGRERAGIDARDQTWWLRPMGAEYR